MRKVLNQVQPCSTSSKHVFKVCVYNQEVRDLVNDNEHHVCFQDDWAEGHVHDVVASDAEEARRVVENRFPPDDGFVVDRVSAA